MAGAGTLIGFAVWDVVGSYVELQFDLSDWRVYAIVKSMVISAFPAIFLMPNFHLVLWLTLYLTSFVAIFVAVYPDRRV